MNEPTRWNEAPEDVVALLAYVEPPPELTPTVKAWSRKRLVTRMRDSQHRRWAAAACAGLALAAAAAFGIVWLTSPDQTPLDGEMELQNPPDVEMVAVDEEPGEESVSELPGQVTVEVVVGEQVEERDDKPPRTQVQRTPRPRSPTPTTTGNGTLFVQTSPASSVEMDGNLLGQTPLRMELPAGTHRLVLRQSNLTIPVVVQIRDGQTVRLVRDLSNLRGVQPTGLGTVVVNTTPPARVEVAGVDHGMTPARLELPVGTQRIVLRTDNVRSAVEVQVRDGETTRVSRNLGGTSVAQTGSFGTMMINSVPWAEIYVDGRRVGNTPQRFQLRAGSHRIRLVAADGRSVVRTVRVQADQVTRLSIRL